MCDGCFLLLLMFACFSGAALGTAMVTLLTRATPRYEPKLDEQAAAHWRSDALSKRG